MEVRKEAAVDLGSPSIVEWGPAALSARAERSRQRQAQYAGMRERWVTRNSYYYKLMRRMIAFLVEPGKRVLNIRSQTGFFLDAMRPSKGVGVELTEEMVAAAKEVRPSHEYHACLPEEFTCDETFDYILLNDLGDTVDIQKTLLHLRQFSSRHTRIIIYTYNHLWEPLLRFGDCVGLRMPQPEMNWLSEGDVQGLLHLSGYEPLKAYRSILCPKYMPLLAPLLNGVIAKLPLINQLCMSKMIVARPVLESIPAESLSVSVVIPCKNEAGNIADAVRRIPSLGRSTEIIFCDDKSTDGTADEVRKMQGLFPEKIIKLVEGPGISKSKNVWTGFGAASGDVLMILDADLTVMPEELPYFLEVLASGRAEFVNGSRLVYPVPKEAMKGMNMIGNKCFSVLFSFILGQRVKDTLCGTKVLWRSDWERMRPLVGTWGIFDRWGDYELLFGAAKLNLRIVDLPVHYQERIYGVTKMTKVFSNGLIMLRMCFFGWIKLKCGY